MSLKMAIFTSEKTSGNLNLKGSGWQEEPRVAFFGRDALE
jgi:hypothetical protein